MATRKSRSATKASRKTKKAQPKLEASSAKAASAKSAKSSTKAKMTVSESSDRSPAFFDRRVEKLREIVQILEGSSVTEFKYEDEELELELARGSRAPTVAETPVPAPSVVAGRAAATPVTPVPSALATEAAASEDEGYVLRSPFVGTFYSAPSPDAPQFTDVGQQVKRGQTLCIVEAMKLMNEIESEVDGTVLEVLVPNATAVQYGDPLFKIRPQ